MSPRRNSPMHPSAGGGAGGGAAAGGGGKYFLVDSCIVQSNSSHESLRYFTGSSELSQLN